MKRRSFLYGRLAVVLAVLLSTTAPPTAGATAIVAVRTPEAIGIAADSLVTVKGSSKPLTGQTECKIGEEGDVIFALAGLAADPDRSFDLRRVIRSALADGGPTAADRVASATSTALKTELTELRDKPPALFDRFIAGRSGPLARVLLAAFSGETPWIEVFTFTGGNRDGQTSVEVLRQRCPGACNPEKVIAVYLADGSPIEQALRSEKLAQERPEQAAGLLVKRVIEAGTPGVGPPVDVVRIDRDGISWIARKPSCCDDPEYAPEAGKSVQGDGESGLPLRTR